MQHAGRLYFAFVFAVHSLTAPFWILCHATGPEAHDRLELLFASCCNCCEGMPSCALDSNDCGSCHDERLDHPSVIQPLRDPCPVLHRTVLSASPVALGVSLQEPALLQDHSGDPPLFLTHCNFRI